MDGLQIVLGLLDYLGLTKEAVVPLLIFGFIGYLLLVRKIDSKINPLTKAIQKLNHAVVELQTFLRVKYTSVSFEHRISPFSKSMSPIVLKPQYKHFVKQPGIIKQVTDKEDDLVNWLKGQKPSTGLDAQREINHLIESGQVEKFLNLKKYKSYVYQKGRTLIDANGILAVYLYEAIIPKVIKP